MLHIVELAHGPTTCAAVHPHIGDLARNGFAQMDEVSGKHGVSVQGAWMDPTGHITYVLADSHNAHAISAAMAELKFFHWNEVRIRPVQPIKDALKLAAH